MTTEQKVALEEVRNAVAYARNTRLTDGEIMGVIRNHRWSPRRRFQIPRRPKKIHACLWQGLEKGRRLGRKSSERVVLGAQRALPVIYG